MSADCNPFAISHSLFMSVTSVYVFLLPWPMHTFPCLCLLCHSPHCSLPLSVRLSVSPPSSPRSLPSSASHLHADSLPSPTLRSPDARLSFFTAVTVLFSFINSEAPKLLKAEQLYLALLFAQGFFTPTLITSKPWADAIKMLTSNSNVQLVYKYRQVVYIAWSNSLSLRWMDKRWWCIS